MENKYKNSKQKNKNSFADKKGFSGGKNKQSRSRVLSLTQLLSRVRKQRPGIISSPVGAVAASVSPQQRNLQFAGDARTNQKGVGSYGNSISTFGEVKGKGASLGGMNKGGSRMESQKEEQKRQNPIKPIIPPKSLVIILREKPDKILYNRRIIDYKHCGLLQRYIGLGGKILPRRQTRLTAKQQRYIAKTIKSARIMGLLPFVSKEKGFFR
jgi:small subunit ribosomal protein S18